MKVRTPLNGPSGIQPDQTILWPGENSLTVTGKERPGCRPAVSRHLRLLKDAGLVIDEPRGTRRLYRLRDEGVEAVQSYLAEVWGQAAARFRLLAENTSPTRERQ